MGSLILLYLSYSKSIRHNKAGTVFAHPTTTTLKLADIWLQLPSLPQKKTTVYHKTPISNRQKHMTSLWWVKLNMAAGNSTLYTVEMLWWLLLQIEKTHRILHFLSPLSVFFIRAVNTGWSSRGHNEKVFGVVEPGKQKH